MEYFEVAEISDIEKLELNLYQKFDDSLCSYDELFNHADNSEILIKVGIDTFIMKATLVEATHKLFTMTKITELSKGLQLDPLTGIYKKEYLDEILKKFLRNKQSFPLAILDLDDFKRVNDTYGHLIGDQVLKEFVQLVKQHICKNDFFARWGGEEFMLLLEDNTIEESKEKIEKLRETIDKHPFETIGHLTSSFGLAYTTNCDDIDSIIRRADKALYEAKANGKNQIIFKS
jgi:diguanylate cyclase (GGDEF)-like protein